MEKLIAIIIFSIILTGCKKADKAQEFSFTFESGYEGWIVGYSDYPSDISPDDSVNLYEMFYEHTNLPGISPAQSGIRVMGHNRSDDLFMFIKKKITGLSPATNYEISFRVELASDVPSGSVGIGGSPAESVIIKAGAKASEPVNVVDNGNWYRLNIDKGNQSMGGNDVVILGNVGVAEDTEVYTLIIRTNTSPLLSKTDSEGNLWVMIGTDSGFEGLTDIYYSAVKLILQQQ